MTKWNPRRWPLSPALAREYAGVDARKIPTDGAPSLIGLRITGRLIGPRGAIAILDMRQRRPAPGSLVVADLPARLAQLVGFAGPAIVARHYAPTADGFKLWPFATAPRQPANAALPVRHRQEQDGDDRAGRILGTVVAVLDGLTPGWSTWRGVARQLHRAARSAPVALTIESDTFDDLRGKLAAAARVYDCIEAPADLLASSRSLPASERRELRHAIRHARAKGLRPRELAAIGGDLR